MTRVHHHMLPLPAGWTAGPVQLHDSGAGHYPARLLTGPGGQTQWLDAALLSPDGARVLDSRLPTLPDTPPPTPAGD